MQESVFHIAERVGIADNRWLSKIRVFRRVFVVLTAVFMIHAGLARADWTMPGGGPGADPVESTYPGITLGTLWTSPVTYVQTHAYPEPCVTVAAGRVFSVGDDPISGNPILYALNEQTGTVIWSEPVYGDGNLSPDCPAIDGSHLFLVGATSSVSSFAVSELNASDGSTVWTYNYSALRA
jgi:outer membrane protein assembly factor BamB